MAVLLSLLCTAIDARATADALIRSTGIKAEFRSSERIVAKPPQTRFLYRGFEVIVQDDGRYSTLRNLASIQRRRILYDNKIEPELRISKDALSLAAAKVADKVHPGSSKWRRSERMPTNRRPRMFGEGWMTGTVTFNQEAYGHRTNGCGNGVIVQVDAVDGTIAGITVRSGWTYKKPNIKISKARAVEIANTTLKYKTGPTSIELGYGLPTWAFGKDRRRNDYACILMYTISWPRGFAMVDAETGEIVGGSRAFGLG